MTVDETWARYYAPETETKAQSHQWVVLRPHRPKKFTTQPSTGKVMAILFWDAKGVIMFDFFNPRKVQ